MITNRDLFITLIMVMSADGIVAERTVQNSFEWSSSSDKEQFINRIQDIGTVLMGSNTYRSIGQQPYEGVKHLVLTHQPQQFDSHQNLEFLQGSVSEICEHLARNDIKHLALLGGPNINAQFLEEKTVDEIFLTIEPLILGQGINMVEHLTSPIHLELKHMNTMKNSNSSLFHYKVKYG